MPGAKVFLGPFSGGLATSFGINSGALADNELTRLVNMHVMDDGSLMARGPIESIPVSVTDTGGTPLSPATSRVLGIYYQDKTIWHLIVVIGNKLVALLRGDPKSVETIRTFTSFAEAPLDMAQFDTYMYFVSRDLVGFKWAPGSAAVNVTGMPRGSSIVFLKGRLFIGGTMAAGTASRVYYSHIDKTGVFPDTWNGKYFDVGYGKGGQITALVDFNEEIYIFKEMSVHKHSYSSSIDTAAINDISVSVGAEDSFHVVKANSSIYVYYRGAVYEYFNGYFGKISTQLDFIEEDNTDFYSSSIVLGSMGQYITLSFRSNFYVYNLQTKAWSTWRTGFGVPNRFTSLPDTLDGNTFIGGFSDTGITGKTVPIKPFDVSESIPGHQHELFVKASGRGRDVDTVSLDGYYTSKGSYYNGTTDVYKPSVNFPAPYLPYIDLTNGMLAEHELGEYGSWPSWFSGGVSTHTEKSPLANFKITATVEDRFNLSVDDFPYLSFAGMQRGKDGSSKWVSSLTDPVIGPPVYDSVAKVTRRTFTATVSLNAVIGGKFILKVIPGTRSFDTLAQFNAFTSKRVEIGIDFKNLRIERVYEIRGSTSLAKYNSATRHINEQIEAIDCVVETKSFDFGEFSAFKRLFWWGIDVRASTPVTGITILAGSKSAARWRDFDGMTIAELSYRQWGDPGGSSSISSDLRTTADTTSIPSANGRYLIKYPKSYRFRQLQFRIEMVSYGNRTTSPLELFRIVAVATPKTTPSGQVTA